MKEFQLFSEWRERILYGESLADAVGREKKLQRPDIFKDGVKIEGEIVTIKQVIGPRNVGGSIRGNRKFESVLIELSDGRIRDVDGYEIIH